MYDGINNFTLPEWIDNETNPVGGLDLLGLRNVAQTISNHCLNGITTISPQIRYLCLRSWFIQMYEKCNLPDNYSQFIDFSSKLEGAVAIGTLLYKPDIKGVVGGTLASDVIEESDEQVNIKRLVQQLVLNMYTGPSIDLGICFNRNSGITGLTKERGILLANAVMQKSKDFEVVKKILKDKEIESFNRGELTELGKLLSIKNIPEDERELLIDIVVPEKASPNGWENDIRRIASYTLLLQLTHDHGSIPTIDDFFKVVSNLSENIHSSLNEILNGWQCYLIRDALAVSHEKALQFVVEELKESGKIKNYRNQIIQTVMNDIHSIANELLSIGIIADTNAYDDLHFIDVYNKIEAITREGNILNEGIFRWENQYLNESVFIERLRTNDRGTVAIIPIMWLISYFRLMEGLNENIISIQLLSRGGWGRMGIKEVIIPTIQKWKKDNPLFSQVIAELIGRTVDQHVRIAWSRIATDINRDVSVMNVDGYKWQYSKNYYGGRTASRLEQALGWLNQLKLIDAQGITSDGKEILNRGYKSLKKYYSN
ncbi:hypothetical protein EB821_01055 [Candidatus Marinimicrobia bacterium PRS2]|nr:hypothetical protein EB821_01055 [Candidatus Marinimicrobia bacterium PRS2]